MTVRPINAAEATKGRDGERQALKLLCLWRQLGLISDFGRLDYFVIPGQTVRDEPIVLPDSVPLPPAAKWPWHLEVKSQERFDPPPFSGHGLALDQLERFRRLSHETHFPTRLFVFERKAVWDAWLDELESHAPALTTNGPDPRRVYDLRAFRGQRYDAGAVEACLA